MDIKNLLTEGEEVMWSGKPKKSAYIFKKFFTLLPIAIVWACFDAFIIYMILSNGVPSKMLWFFVPFFLLHLMPVWMWLGSIITAKKRWENTQYVITDKRIIIQSGFIDMDYKTIYYKEIKNVNLKVSLIDKIFKVGDIYFDTDTVASFQIQGSQVVPTSQALLSIENTYELYTKFQKIILDIQTDIFYPNELRPDENPGYNTKYESKM